MNKKILLNLVSEWCSECRELQKLYRDKRIARLIDEFDVRYIDIDEYPHILNRFNFGGLPSILFIRGDKLLYGFSGTPSVDEMIKIIERIDLYEPTKLKELGESRPDTRDLSREDLIRITNQIMKNIDWVNGGFTTEYKFFDHDEYLFLLKIFLRKGVEGYLRTVTYSINKIINSRFWNNQIGGFSRMSVNGNWDEPDNNFLSELNSKSLKLLKYISMILREDRYTKYIEKLSILLSKKLYKKGFIRGLYLHDDEVMLDERVIPHIELSVIRDLIEVSRYGSYRKLGLRALDRLDEYIEIDLPKKYQTLYSYSRLLDAYIEAYSFTGNNLYLDKAIETSDYIIKKFGDETGSYKDTFLHEYSYITRRPLDINSELAYSFMKIYYLLDDDEYKIKAYEILKYYSNLYEKYGFKIGIYGLALDSYINGLPILSIKGFKKIPRNIINVIKSYSLFKWGPGENSIEYIDGEIKIKLT